ncbi:MAG: ABC-F family ATP-binding cassette domain-containing protein [Rhodospirillales bacterium]|nr:ABC-F family ATP-binding cassette domain-containing protein [Rhodospirillales bacterium]
MLRIEKLTYRIGSRLLFDQSDASVNPGHRIGLVGRNGTGKTTLLRLIVGDIEQQEGRIEMPARWRVGITRQEAPGGPQSLIATVLNADGELASLEAEAHTATDPHRIAEIHTRLRDLDAHTAPARAARILAGLGFDEAAQQRPCAEFSGGWRMRVALAALLFTQPDLLLLDEPTNHLDLEAALWLEDYLRTYPGTLLLVSHDRGLLNRVVEEILHLEGGKLTLYQGGYDRFEQTRRARLEQSEKMRMKVDAQRAHLQSFVDRFRYKASKAKQAQSRLRMLERLPPIVRLQDEGAVDFTFPEPDPLAPPLMTMDALDVGYDGTAVLKKLSLRLDADDRIGLLGANGNGKSTLIKLLAGRLEPSAGAFVRSGKLRVGYFAQHQAEELDVAVTPVVELGRRRPRDAEVALRSQLGRFGFSQQRAETKIGNLSGGEKARLLFALMTADRPHVLLLDEPTNHLDVASRQALIEAINNFTGAVVMVSHDPHVLALTTDRLWLVAGGTVSDFDGDMEDYRSLLLGRSGGADNRNASAKDGTTGNKALGNKATGSKKERRRLAEQRREALAPLKKQLVQAERAVETLESEKARLIEAMADPDLYQGDPGRVAEQHKRLDKVQKDLDRAVDAWADLQITWDDAQSEAD